jgi:hypothetical protein
MSDRTSAGRGDRVWARKGQRRDRRSATQLSLLERMAHLSGQLSQLVAAGPGGPRKDMKIMAWHNGGAGGGEVEISHGAIEAEQLFDPERA